MFKGITRAGQFLLFHNDECLVTQTVQDYGSLERIRKRLALTLVYAFFVEEDGPYLAELKANKLWKCAKAHLPKDLEFELSDDALSNILQNLISRNAPQWFPDYCLLTDGSEANFTFVLKPQAPTAS
jgi:hypothetical protein